MPTSTFLSRAAAFAGALVLTCFAFVSAGCDGSPPNGPGGSGGTGGQTASGGNGGDGGEATGTGGAGGTVGMGGMGVGGQGGGTTTTGEGGAGGNPAGAPQLGAHGLAFYFLDESNTSFIDAPALDTAPSGSTILVSTGRGSLSAAGLPTDNKGNDPYMQLGANHSYTLWPTSGTSLFAFEGISGGASHVVTAPNAPGDEVTLAVVEVMNGTHVQDFQWVERLNGQPLTSAPVTTTGPATLVAFWWGDANVENDKVAVPNNGFTVLDSVGMSGPLVQCFVAAKEVPVAGTYDVTWDATPAQGAQLWLVAVE